MGVAFARTSRPATQPARGAHRRPDRPGQPARGCMADLERRRRARRRAEPWHLRLLDLDGFKALQRHLRPPRRRRAASPAGPAARQAPRGRRAPRTGSAATSSACSPRSAASRRGTLAAPRARRSPRRGEGFAVDQPRRAGRDPRRRATTPRRRSSVADTPHVRRQGHAAARRAGRQTATCCCATLREREPELHAHAQAWPSWRWRPPRAGHGRRGARRGRARRRAARRRQDRDPRRDPARSPGRSTRRSGPSCAATR